MKRNGNVGVTMARMRYSDFADVVPDTDSADFILRLDDDPPRQLSPAIARTLLRKLSAALLVPRRNSVVPMRPRAKPLPKR